MGPDEKTELIISHDKDKYNWGDTIVFSIDVKNNSNQALKGIKVCAYAKNSTDIINSGDEPIINILNPGKTQTLY